MASAMGRLMPEAAAPAATSTSRISSVAYAVEDKASEAKTANPLVLLTCSCAC
ncbi:hypothetical protein D3C80_2226450 [compost metagenome]